MPELTDTPLVLGDFPPIISALIGHRLVALEAGGQEGTITIEQVLSLFSATYLPAGSVSEEKIANDAVTAAKLAALAVTNEKIANSTLTMAKLASAAIADLKWLSKAVGEFYYADDGVTGVDIPPADSSLYRFVELTAGLTGVGQYNNGCLASESVSGSAPLVLATAQVSLAGSPLNGQTIRLLNTERRMLRAGSAGTIQADALQNITGSVGTAQESFSAPAGAFKLGAAGPNNRPNNGSATTNGLEFDASLVARTDTETRGKNIGVRVFRRIK